MTGFVTVNIVTNLETELKRVSLVAFLRAGFFLVANFISNLSTSIGLCGCKFGGKFYD